MLSAKRDGVAAARFFRQVLTAHPTQAPPVSTVDKNAAAPAAMATLKAEETLAAQTKFRQSKYLNNVIEQAHRNIKPIVRAMMGFHSFSTARRTLSAIEAINMIRKAQVNGIVKGDSVSQAKFIEEIFGVSA